MKLKECILPQGGIFNPNAAQEFLNDVIKKQNPEAFINQMETITLKKIEREKKIKNADQQKQRRQQNAEQLDKALFDFDEEVDLLDNVEERYPVDIQ